MSTKIPPHLICIIKACEDKNVESFLDATLNNVINNTIFDAHNNVIHVQETEQWCNNNNARQQNALETWQSMTTLV
jgi:hypothetical protein